VPKQRRVVFVAGPTGSGKTTLVKRLTERAAVYIEDASLNPYLAVRSGNAFDAGASQTWFLDQIRPDGTVPTPEPDGNTRGRPTSACGEQGIWGDVL
jgi:hypothetical protein